MLFTLKGTPFVYQGDELGMTNYPFKGIEDFDDIAVKNAWNEYVVSKKVSAEAFLANIRKISRDNARTPMQWDDSSNGGFTTAVKPWLLVNPNFKEVNAKQSLADPNSIYRYYRRMVELRKKTPVLVYGDFKDIDPANTKVYENSGRRGLLNCAELFRRGAQLRDSGGTEGGAAGDFELGRGGREHRNAADEDVGGASLQNRGAPGCDCCALRNFA
jgi:glycosidase